MCNNLRHCSTDHLHTIVIQILQNNFIGAFFNNVSEIRHFIENCNVWILPLALKMRMKSLRLSNRLL